MNAFLDVAKVPERLGRALPLGDSQQLLCGCLEGDVTSLHWMAGGLRTVFVCLGVTPPVPPGGAASFPRHVPTSHPKDGSLVQTGPHTISLSPQGTV